MKNNILISVIACLFFQFASAQSVDERMVSLINSGDNFILNREYTIAKDSIQSKTVKLLAEGFLATAFNKPQNACEVFGELVSNHQEDLGLNGIAASLELMAGNLRYLGEYKKATDMLKSYLDQTATFNELDNALRTRLERYLPLGQFGDAMKPEIIRPDRDCEVPIIDVGDSLLKELMYINVNLRGKEVPFVFDTGCDGYATNFVTEKFAKENGIRILEDSVILYGAGGTGYARLGMTDSMQIGDIIYKNVAFTIVPGDNALPVDSLKLEAVLGSAFMKAMGEFHIYPQQKKIVFPIKQSSLPSYGSNMMLSGGQPYVEVDSKSGRLLLHFDTGGGISLSTKYYMKHKDSIEAIGKLKTDGGVGGFGGMKKMHKYILPDMTFRISGQERKVENVEVLAEATHLDEQISDGSIGADFVKLFNKVIVNFDKMFVAVE